MKKAECDYIKSTINEGLQSNNSKPFWKYIKSKKHENIGVSPLTQGVQLVTSSKEKADILIRQFQSVFTKDACTLYISQYAKHHKASKKLDSNTNNQRKGCRSSTQESKPFKSIGA
jgi:hypothetical protein